MTEGSAPRKGQQARSGATLADAISVMRIPLAAAFAVTTTPLVRGVILVVAGASDLLDGAVARTRGASRWGPVLDPVADKIFVATAVVVVVLDGALTWWEAALVLSRDVGAAIGFVATWTLRSPRIIHARWLGKVVTACQFLLVFTFLIAPAWVRPVAWGTAALGALAVWDYLRVAGRAALSLGR